ncbi:MAG TPA: ABC transporter substrate-binding protein [Gemmatimonadota bacterium]|nr:ABC transporter substrate-binding protein [Gemmatimonadota bacterium]
MRRTTFMVIALAVTWGGCRAADDGNRILIGEASDFGALLPIIRNTALDGELNELLYLSLSSARWESGALRFQADDLSLAERWELGSDSTVLTYHLRGDAVWSDGEPLDASDVVFTFELLRRPEVGSLYQHRWEQIDSVVMRSAHEVAFYFKRRYPGMLRDTRIGIVPEHVFAATVADGSPLVSHPTLLDPAGVLVVSGPFRVAEWRRGERLVLEPNPRAFTTQPQIETIVFRVIPDMTTRLVELLNGNIDVYDLGGPLPDARAEALAGRDLRVETIEDRYYDFIALNGARFEPFRDPLIRMAVSIAIDRQTILDGLGIAAYARPAAGPYPPIFGELADPSLNPDGYFPDMARAILTAQGWSDSDGDGVLDRNGTPFVFTLLTQSGNERRTSAAEIIQEQLARVGIHMEVRALEFNTLLGRVFDEGEYEAALLGWQVPLEPEYLAINFWPADGPINITGYSSAVLDSVIQMARAASSIEQATPHWRAAAEIIAADRPFAFLWYFDDVVLLSERVKGVRIDTYGVYQNLHEWRLEH